MEAKKLGEKWKVEIKDMYFIASYEDYYRQGRKEKKRKEKKQICIVV